MYESVSKCIRYQSAASIRIDASLPGTIVCVRCLPQSQRSRAWSAELFMTGRNSELSSRPRLCLCVSRSLCCNILLSQSSSTNFICHRENVSLRSPCSRAFTTLKSHKHKACWSEAVLQISFLLVGFYWSSISINNTFSATVFIFKKKKKKKPRALQQNHNVTITFLFLLHSTR